MKIEALFRCGDFTQRKRTNLSYLEDDLLSDPAMPKFSSDINEKLIDDLTETYANTDKHAETEDRFFVCLVCGFCTSSEHPAARIMVPLSAHSGLAPLSKGLGWRTIKKPNSLGSFISFFDHYSFGDDAFCVGDAWSLACHHCSGLVCDPGYFDRGAVFPGQMPK
jgi:hypothetical protein